MAAVLLAVGAAFVVLALLLAFTLYGIVAAALGVICLAFGALVLLTRADARRGRTST